MKSVPTHQTDEQPTKIGTKSKTAYPYNDLDQSILVAKAIQEKGGGVCGSDHLAVWLGYSSARSGTYFSRVQAAKLFGLVQSLDDKLSLTERAHSIISPVMPDDESKARVEAFLAIPLFRAVFDRVKGQPLPPDVGMKNLLKTQFGIVEERVNPAFRILMDSAEQAGLFRTTGDRSRMIIPVMSAVGQAKQSEQRGSEPPPVERVERNKTGGGGDDGAPPGVHTAIVGLLREMPPAGTEWPTPKKERFMQAFRATIDFIYPDPEG